MGPTAVCKAAGELLRDLGASMLCRACLVVYLPGTLRFRNCGAGLVEVRKPAKVRRRRERRAA